MKNKKPITMRLNYWLNPVFSHTFTRIGDRTRVVVKRNGGMAGGETVYYGIVNPCKRAGFKDFVTIELTESQRSMDVNPKDIVQMEDVRCWKEVVEHSNPNFSEKVMVRLFHTKMDVANVVSTGIFSHDNNSKQFEMIEALKI